MLGKSQSWSITLKGTMNPTVHHPSWYHLIGQLSKDELASTVASKEVLVTPASSRFKSPLFSIECDKKQWQVKTRHNDARLHILQVTVKSFDDLLPETRIKQFAFEFTFAINISHDAVAEFLRPFTRDFIDLKGQEEIATTLMSTTTTDEVRRTKVRLTSSPEAANAALTFSYTYPLENQKLLTLRQMSMVENYELDYEEAASKAHQLTHKLIGDVPSSSGKATPKTPGSN